VRFPQIADSIHHLDQSIESSETSAYETLFLLHLQEWSILSRFQSRAQDLVLPDFATIACPSSNTFNSFDLIEATHSIWYIRFSDAKDEFPAKLLVKRFGGC
jgi:hypothetical protein